MATVQQGGSDSGRVSGFKTVVLVVKVVTVVVAVLAKW